MATIGGRFSKKRFKPEKKSRLGLLAAVALLVLLAAYAGVVELSRPHVHGDHLRLDTFFKAAADNKVRNVTLLQEDAYWVGDYVRPDGSAGRYNVAPPKDVMGNETASLANEGISTAVDTQTGKRVASLATVLLPGLALIVLVAYLVTSSRRKTGLFAVSSGARRIDSGQGGVSFADVAGQQSAVDELKEIKEFLSDPERFTALGAVVPKGVLLYGPPGCGKTLLARALAGEAGANFFSISGSDFVELYVGVGASRVRDLFKQARQNAPALVFIDELDSVGRARGTVGDVPSHGEQEQALNQILAEMDGFSPTEGIIVVAATNRPDILDQALLRPGRFDRTIGLERPSESDRLAILSVHASTKQLLAGTDLNDIARRAIGLTGADLASVMNEGALLAARAGRSTISGSELEQALQRILEAPARQRRLSLRGERSIGERFAGDDRVTFADVAGQDTAVAELNDIKAFLADPDRFGAIGAIVPKGVLLYGPPGCGKTLLARALAGEANAAFFSVRASEFVEAVVGRGAARVREVFAEARSMAPAIVFLDELDSVGGARTARSGMQGEQEQALNQILAEMDGFTPADGVMVLGATNRPDTLDQALLRPGRFDRTIGMTLPDAKGRLAILSVHAKSRALAPGVDLSSLADRAIGLTGADLANVVNEAALVAVRTGRTSVTQAELEDALGKILAAPGDQRRLSLRSRTVGQRSAGGETRVTFADVAGMDDAIAELAEVRDLMARPHHFTKLGARPPRGILLSGPPGCGKTLLARAVAGEVNAAFFSVAGSQFVEVFVGEGSLRVRDLFAEARAMAPAIVFIDEIDAIGARRGTGSFDGHREREQTLNQFLIELDGFRPDGGVIVIAATNRADILDPALVRPGRFDRHVVVTPPHRDGRRAILALHAGDKHLAPDVDLDTIAGLTQGFSGADLANVMNEAALLAGRNDLEAISMIVVEEALDRALLGVASRGGAMSAAERDIVAYHEAGHALVVRSLPGSSPSRKLTIVARAASPGHCTVLDVHDQALVSRSGLIDQMAALLGGWAAEQLVFGEASSGSSADVQRVGQIARRMVREYGFSDRLGPLGFPEGTPGPDGMAYRSVSEETARAIDAEVHNLVEEAAGRARGLLGRSRHELDLVADALVESETVGAEELDRLLARATQVSNGPARRLRSDAAPVRSRP